MECRIGCAACCIVISISSAIPGMPSGKPSGVRCVQLADDNRCLLFGKPERPDVCGGLQAAPDMCGQSNEQAYAILERLERETKPN